MFFFIISILTTLFYTSWHFEEDREAINLWCLWIISSCKYGYFCWWVRDYLSVLLSNWVNGSQTDHCALIYLSWRCYCQSFSMIRCCCAQYFSMIGNFWIFCLPTNSAAAFIPSRFCHLGVIKFRRAHQKFKYLCFSYELSESRRLDLNSATPKHPPGTNLLKSFWETLLIAFLVFWGLWCIQRWGPAKYRTHLSFNHLTTTCTVQVQRWVEHRERIKF